MSYVNSLNAQQKTNMATLLKRMIDKGVTNPYAQAAINAVVSKESAFVPRSENLNYSAQRIMQVWPKIKPDVAAKLANNPEALGNYVYSPSFNPSLGNGTNEGYKFRGRGLNQLTGKSNYAKYGSALSYDLVNNPDLMNDMKVASDVAILFFQNGIKTLSNLGTLQKYYNATNINDFKSAKDSLGAIYHINAGVGSSQAKLAADTTGGKAVANSRVDDLLKFISETGSSAYAVVKKNPVPAAIVTVALIVGTWLVVRNLKK